MRRPHRLALIALTVSAALGISSALVLGWDEGEAPAPPHRGAAVGISEPAPVARAGDPSIVAVFESAGGAVGVDLAGFDPDAPRDLVVWQLGDDSGHTEPVGRTRSAADGSFVAEGVLVSARGARLAVAPASHGPGSFVEAPAAAVPPRAEPVPVIWRDGDEIFVGLRAESQVLRFANDRRREVARVEIPAAQRPGSIWRQAATIVAAGEEIAWFAADPPAGERPSWHRLPDPSSGPSDPSRELEKAR